MLPVKKSFKYGDDEAKRVIGSRDMVVKEDILEKTREALYHLDTRLLCAKTGDTYYALGGAW